MSSGGDGKQYGLILPKSKQALSAGDPSTSGSKPKLARSSVFGNQSSSNSEDEASTSTDWMKKKLQSSAKSTNITSAGHSGGMRKQTKVCMTDSQFMGISLRPRKGAKDAINSKLYVISTAQIS